jgi:hypothetical protein
MITYVAKAPAEEYLLADSLAHQHARHNKPVPAGARPATTTLIISPPSPANKAISGS